MRNTQPRKIEAYRMQNGQVLFTEWFDSIRHKRAQTRIEARLILLEQGNFGDYRSVGNGVFELRIHVGAGYRVYFGEVDNTIVLLLCGGDKSSQRRDIARAKTYWCEYKETQR
ncbi:addiction module killer protein [Candidatus Poribacteria bacterium]|nr:MAG: addiction module killer protein [Candidatus Poribacteria bacterium]